ncbi:PREDICTED: pectinesterase/pectinesterase inhibitor PPE8B-like [Prunus mume]|uniref:Pectinesterase n=1 Tax=Prunus mume TaxID=102107 RepID=A0ABM0P2H9_PRUMU|nr:PREDICTED: pectinesterase/pectinesterase inhibitor PPE8B-like [Prunus mume]
MDTFQNMIDSNVAESLRQVTKSIDEVLGMIQVQQQNHLHRHNVTAAPGSDPDPYDPALSRTADVTVSQDGSGKFKRIMDAIAAVPSHSQKQFVIFVKKGVYKEYVKIDKTKMNLVLIGQGMSVTTISGYRSNASGWQTIDSPTFDVRAQGFIAMDIGFENTAGPNNRQAVALSVGGDQSAFHRCKRHHRLYLRIRHGGFPTL